MQRGIVFSMNSDDAKLVVVFFRLYFFKSDKLVMLERVNSPSDNKESFKEKVVEIAKVASKVYDALSYGFKASKSGDIKLDTFCSLFCSFKIYS